MSEFKFILARFVTRYLFRSFGYSKPGLIDFRFCLHASVSRCYEIYFYLVSGVARERERETDRFVKVNRAHYAREPALAAGGSLQR